MSLQLKSGAAAKNLFNILKRCYAEQSFCDIPEDPCPEKFKGLVLGVYSDSDDRYHPGKFTASAEKHDYVVNCRMKDLLEHAIPVPKLGEHRLFYDLEKEYTVVALVGLGKECQGYDVFEQIDEGKDTLWNGNLNYP